MTVTIPKRLLWWVIAIAVASPLAVTGLNVYYTNSVDHRTRAEFTEVQRQADQRWCDLLRALTEPTLEDPTTVRGKELLSLYQELFSDLGCKRI